MITILDPTAPRVTAGASPSWPFDGLHGKVVGFIDNAKPNFNHLVDELAELLTQRHGVSRIVKVRKRSASVPAEDHMLESVVSQCDLVITGSGD